MTRHFFTTVCSGFLLASLSLQAETRPVTTALPPDARVAIIGDSITEQKLYSRFIETYLLTCTGRKDIRCFQLGWGGETAAAFSQRLENDLGVFQPTVATTCYGMNDGRYVPYADAIGNDYEKWMRLVLTKLKAAGVKSIVAGTPGAVDTKYFVRAGATPDQYNESLRRLGEMDRKLAAELGTGFADVHSEMIQAMNAAKAKLGADYDVCGRDGVHPGSNGHLLMAAAFLKGLGLDGNIGDISVDMNGPSSASEGHTATGSNGMATVTSTKWPFVVDSSTQAILPFCRFNQELNRLTLKVKNLSSAKAKVTWGKESKVFTKEELSAGINLTEAFNKTPFDQAAKAVTDALTEKQGFETPIIKGIVTNFRMFVNEAKADAEFAAALKTLKTKLMAKQQLLDEKARSLVVPVTHEIKVEPAA